MYQKRHMYQKRDFNESAKTRASSNASLIIRNTEVSLAELKAVAHKQSTSAPRFLGCNFKLLPPVLWCVLTSSYEIEQT